jgi:hypothetical protein
MTTEPLTLDLIKEWRRAAVVLSYRPGCTTWLQIQQEHYDWLIAEATDFGEGDRILRQALIDELCRQVRRADPKDDGLGWRQAFLNLAQALEVYEWFPLADPTPAQQQYPVPIR